MAQFSADGDASGAGGSVRTHAKGLRRKNPGIGAISIAVALFLTANADGFALPGTPRTVLRPRSSLRPPRAVIDGMEETLVTERREELGLGPDALLLKAVSAPERAAFCTVNEGASVYEAVRTMTSASKGSVLVVGADGEVKGIFTERDFVSKVIDKKLKTRETTVDDVMTPKPDLVTLDVNATVGDALGIMSKGRFRHLPVLESTELTVEGVRGVLSIEDLVKVMKEDDIKLAGEYALAALPAWAEPLTGDEARLLERQRANAAAQEKGPQDILRAGFVAVCVVVGAGLLQADWVHAHETLSLSAVFAFGYLGITLEEQFGFNKAALGLLMATALWTIYGGNPGATGIAVDGALEKLSEHVAEVSEITFFLIGAMTIVEAVDAHQGFELISEAINVNSKRNLFFLVAVISFFMSGVLDNLTTTIVMIGLLKKLVPDEDERKLFGGLVVVAANAGGAWSPVGDVTTTLLWAGGQVSVMPTITSLILPSIVSTVITTVLLARQLEEDPVEAVGVPGADSGRIINPVSAAGGVAPRGKLVFATGVLGLLSVPLFKGLTGLPPYMGMLSALGVMWLLTDVLHAGDDEKSELMVPAALRKIDTAGVLFFFGVLLSVAALESAGILQSVATFLDNHISSQELLAGSIGAASAVIDNVPLVAASMGMYDLSVHPQDDSLWQLIAFCAGTGGSMLVIGSAAGVALMGLEKVDFGWYAKRISLPAAAGYVAGIAVYVAQSAVFGG